MQADTPAPAIPAPATPEPAWDIARLFPAQGHWSVAEYFALPGNHLIEYSDGYIEVLPMPSETHQLIVARLYHLLHQFITANRLGIALFAPLRVQLWENKYREPDIVFMLDKHAYRRGEQFWQGADLVMEVMSPDDPKRDADTKKREYAQANIPEYWLIDPAAKSVTVLTQDKPGQAYRIHGVFQNTGQAGSVLLPGFAIAVDQLFA